MAALLDFALAAVHAVDPEHPHPTMADAIAHVVEDERPLFVEDSSREKTIALVVAVAWREGSLRERVQGDCVDKTKEGRCIAHPRSFCTMQIHASSGGDESLNDDPQKCIRAGMAILRQSMRACTDHPVAYYAAGPGACTNERAQRISRDRMALAARVRAVASKELKGK
ncbi:MAG: hypothetical protein KIT84_09130 [Labilithrix sp.]|nr:hypothetical protein [Labilithrix sp.]MCW5811163.1 hypothetical protein [Labilithrix sp.]